jgi:hypothetical protein
MNTLPNPDIEGVDLQGGQRPVRFEDILEKVH